MLEIYMITNLVTRKIYVGKSIPGREKRFRRHINDAKNGSNLPLHRSMRKHGFDKFTVCLLDTAKTKEELNELEVFWIKKLRARDPEVGYNLTDGGEGCAGVVQSEETRAKRSESLKGMHTGKFVGEKSYRFRHDLSTEQMVEMYQNGKSSGDIARELGASKETINSRLKSAGVVFRSNSDAQKLKYSSGHHAASYREDVSTDDMVSMFSQGLTHREIADKLGVSKACVKSRLVKLGIRRTPHRCNLDKGKVSEMYQEGYTAYEIADLFNVSPGVIYRSLEESGVPIRPKSSQPKKALRTEKVCYVCKVLLPLTSYNKDRTTVDGHMAICRECSRVLRKKKSEEIKESRIFPPPSLVSYFTEESCSENAETQDLADVLGESSPSTPYEDISSGSGPEVVAEPSVL